jgi:hypothetical protein
VAYVGEKERSDGRREGEREKGGSRERIHFFWVGLTTCMLTWLPQIYVWDEKPSGLVCKLIKTFIFVNTSLYLCL